MQPPILGEPMGATMASVGPAWPPTGLIHTLFRSLTPSFLYLPHSCDLSSTAAN